MTSSGDPGVNPAACAGRWLGGRPARRPGNLEAVTAIPFGHRKFDGVLFVLSHTGRTDGIATRSVLGFWGLEGFRVEVISRRRATDRAPDFNQFVYRSSAVVCHSTRASSRSLSFDHTATFS